MSKKKPKSFAERLLAWRAHFGYGRHRAAEELGINKHSLRKWEKCRRSPRLAGVIHVLERLTRDGF